MCFLIVATKFLPLPHHKPPSSQGKWLLKFSVIFLRQAAIFLLIFSFYSHLREVTNQTWHLSAKQWYSKFSFYKKIGKMRNCVEKMSPGWKSSCVDLPRVCSNLNYHSAGYYLTNKQTNAKSIISISITMIFPSYIVYEHVKVTFDGWCTAHFFICTYLLFSICTYWLTDHHIRICTQRVTFETWDLLNIWQKKRQKDKTKKHKKSISYSNK